MSGLSLYDLPLDDLIDRLARMGEPAYRARQIFEWLYQKDTGDPDRMTNLSIILRRRLAESFSARMPELEKIVSAGDGTEKCLLRLEPADPRKSGVPQRIECVIMLSASGRQTLCISSQVGCALDCSFCATATMGFARNLHPSEIVGQVILARRRLAERGGLQDIPVAAGTRPSVAVGQRLSNIVFMGMGEPLLNFDNLCIAISNITRKEALGISPSRLTVSTAGVADRLAELAARFAVNIAISLNTPDETLRRRIMPRIARRHDLAALLSAAREIGKTRRKPVTFEYVLLAGVTDTPGQARSLVRLLSDIRCKVNLIPFNPFPASEFKRPEVEQVLAFQKILWDSQIPAYIRWSQGLDVNAACGQLAVGESAPASPTPAGSAAPRPQVPASPTPAGNRALS